MARVDAAELSQRLADHAAAIAEALLGPPSERGGSVWRWGRRGSLALAISGERRGLWHDHERGEGGDVLALIMRTQRCRFPEAVAWSAAWLNGGATLGHVVSSEVNASHKMCSAPALRTRDLARRIWCESVPLLGTIAAAYLLSRGLAVPDWPDDPRVLRFHPSCPRGAERYPAMVAIMTSIESGEACGVHRTFLRPDGSDRLRDGTGKAMLGKAGVIRLSPDDMVTQGIDIAEGIETSLSVLQRTGWRPVWAAASAGAIRTFPILPGLSAVTVFADADSAGIEAARVCALNWRQAGREARVISPPVGDWNDTVRAA